MLRSPKEKFINSPAKEPWKKVINDPAYEDAIVAALAHFVHELPPVPDPQKGWDQASQLAGVRQFIAILTDLPNPEQKQQTQQFRNLKPPQ